MEHRVLGRTGALVSALSLGTVELGVDYGIPASGDFGRPEEAEAVRILEEAVDNGINFFDTAPAYGESERLVGAVLGHRPDCVLATKVTIPTGQGGRLEPSVVRAQVLASLATSRARLRRDVLDVVQVHNATADLVCDGVLVDALLEAQRRGEIRWLGASVYGEDNAIAVVEAGHFDVVQVAHNILDQRMRHRIFDVAARVGVAVISRSALLKGALSGKANALPEHLAPLRSAVNRVVRTVPCDWERLPEFALRFCLSEPGIASVLVGVRTREELQRALHAVAVGRLTSAAMEVARSLAVDDDDLVNPAKWGIP